MNNKNLKPDIIPRSSWGALKPLKKDLTKHRPRRITLHHSGIIYRGSPLPKERIRKLQKWCMDKKNWPDLPYHFKVDLQGKVYKGRHLIYSGDTNTEYDPRGHALICLMGNYERQKVSNKQLGSIVKLCAWLCKAYNISPQTIKGHKDFADTLCPGRDFYRYIRNGTIQKRVERLVKSAK